MDRSWAPPKFIYGYGLAFFMTSLVFGDVVEAEKPLWKYEVAGDFSYESLNDVYCYVGMLPSEKNVFIKLFKEELGDFGEVVRVNLFKDPFKGMGESKLSLWCTCEQESGFSVLNFHSESGFFNYINKEFTYLNIWNLVFLLKSPEEIETYLKKGISTFLEQYKKTNAKAKGHVKFYIPVVELPK